MRSKRTPALFAAAKALRIQGLSYAMIAETLASKGHRVTTSTMHDWLSKDPEAQAGFAAAFGGAPGAEPAPSTPLELPPPAPARAPRSAEEPTDGGPMTPEEFGVWLASQLRELQTAAEEARSAGDGPGRARALRLGGQLAAIMARLQAKSADEGDVVRVRAADIEAASQRALEGLGRTLEAVLGDVATWPRCPHCGEARGAFGDGEVSTVRAMFERAARRGG